MNDCICAISRVYVLNGVEIHPFTVSEMKNLHQKVKCICAYVLVCVLSVVSYEPFHVVCLRVCLCHHHLLLFLLLLLLMLLLAITTTYYCCCWHTNPFDKSHPSLCHSFCITFLCQNVTFRIFSAQWSQHQKIMITITAHINATKRKWWQKDGERGAGGHKSKNKFVLFVPSFAMHTSIHIAHGIYHMTDHHQIRSLGSNIKGMWCNISFIVLYSSLFRFVCVCVCNFVSEVKWLKQARFIVIVVLVVFPLGFFSHAHHCFKLIFCSSSFFFSIPCQSFPRNEFEKLLQLIVCVLWKRNSHRFYYHQYTHACRIARNETVWWGWSRYRSTCTIDNVPVQFGRICVYMFHLVETKLIYRHVDVNFEFFAVLIRMAWGQSITVHHLGTSNIADTAHTHTHTHTKLKRNKKKLWASLCHCPSEQIKNRTVACVLFFCVPAVIVVLSTIPLKSSCSNERFFLFHTQFSAGKLKYSKRLRTQSTKTLRHIGPMYRVKSELEHGMSSPSTSFLLQLFAVFFLLQSNH